MDSEPTTSLDLPYLPLALRKNLWLIHKMANNNDSLDMLDRTLITLFRESLRSRINVILTLIPHLAAESQEREYLDILSRLTPLEHDCTVALSPLRDFPPEIIRQIFSRYTAINQYTSISGEGGSWTLARVCKKWRAIALEHREIWSRISISLQEISTASYAPSFVFSSPVLWLRKMLQRAANRPLHILFSFSPLGGMAPGQEQSLGSQRSFWDNLTSKVKKEEIAVMAVALMSTARWESLVIAEECMLDLPLPLTALSWDALRSLEVRKSGGTAVQWIKGIPNLQEFRLVDVSDGLCSKALKSLPSSVRSITVESTNPRYPIPLGPFADSPFVNLVGLTLSFGSPLDTSIYIDGLYLPRYQNRSMPNLRALHLYNIIEPLRFLSCPVIEEVDVLLDVPSYALFLKQDDWLERILEEFRDRADGLITSQRFTIAYPPVSAWRNVRLM